jgi:hypothetical protein
VLDRKALLLEVSFQDRLVKCLQALLAALQRQMPVADLIGDKGCLLPAPLPLFSRQRHPVNDGTGFLSCGLGDTVDDMHALRTKNTAVLVAGAAPLRTPPAPRR